ncbi:MAG: hypothetical protein MJ162_06680 [Treponema sp.]|nr:hypothetical protein [Treponema sp.]
MIKLKTLKKVISILLLSVFAGMLFAQETTYSAGLKIPADRARTADEGFAAEEFRRGVQAYYKGAFNEAVVQFEKALSYLPDDNLILEWLGKSYYKTGLEGNALSYWQTSSDNGYGGLLLQNKIEIVRERRITGDSEEKLMRLTEVGSFPGTNQSEYTKKPVMVFNGPVSVLTNTDGTFWVTAYNSNELLKMNMNGFVTNRITGPLAGGFDRPLDIVRHGDELLVSEVAGDRVAVLDSKGHFQRYIGSKGRGTGCFIGPQYIACDASGRIYVTDMGNRRVDVFDKEGNGLFFFGKKSDDFKGLKYPTGIAVIGESVFVADEDDGAIYEFDTAGNYIRQLVEEKTFNKPESLKLWNNNLIVSDMNRIVAVSSDTGAMFELARTGNAPSRVTAAVPDINNNMIVTDLTSNEIYVMSKVQELVGGLFVQIENVDSSSFPNVVVEIKVENRHRQPIVGLQLDNFYLKENNRPVSGLRYVGSASNNDIADITIVIDRNLDTRAYSGEIETAVREIAKAMNDRGTLRVITAGAVAVTEYTGKPDGVKDFSIDALKNPLSDNVTTDLAIRLAANNLINAEKKRAVIFITNGKINEKAFSKYTLSEISSYLNNNSIIFSMVQINQGAPAYEYDYLLNNTSGDAYYVFRPEGLGSIVKDILDVPQGVYQLSYTSTLPTNFGENYLPVEAEVYLLNRSGRDETGYFAPLK